MLNHDKLPADLQWFEETYNTGTGGIFITATDHRGIIIACIAAIPYDHRFKHVQLDSQELTYEVCRLYVLPSYRHQKIGRALFSDIKMQLQNQGIKQLYLHTHPFLDGAQLFWEKMGFGLIHQDKDTPFYTIHMQQNIS